MPNALPRLALLFVVLTLLTGLTGDLLEAGMVSHVAAIVATSTALLAAVTVLARLPRAAARGVTP